MNINWDTATDKQKEVVVLELLEIANTLRFENLTLISKCEKMNGELEGCLAQVDTLEDYVENLTAHLDVVTENNRVMLMHLETSAKWKRLQMSEKGIDLDDLIAKALAKTTLVADDTMRESPLWSGL